MTGRNRIDMAPNVHLQARQTGQERTESRFVPCGRHSGPWFCVWTKPQQELLADHSLRSEKFCTFFPQHSVTLANRQQRIEPLFRRYGFVQPTVDGQWVGILYAKGVHGLIRTPSGVPREVPAKAVEILLARCAPNGVVYPEEKAATGVGDLLRVTSGPFAELTGICARTNRDRVWILMSILGREKAVEFSGDVVEVV